MKALKTIVFLCALIPVSRSSFAQSDSAFAARRALVLADSLVNAFRDNRMSAYLEMSYPGVVEYYGGKQGFQDYVQRIRTINRHITEEVPEKLELVQIVNSAGEWQCVIRKTRKTFIDGKGAQVISYIIGQSKDRGQSWKYFDVAFNSVDNIVYIMPDVFDSLAIPGRQIIFDTDEVARVQ